MAARQRPTAAAGPPATGSAAPAARLHGPGFARHGDAEERACLETLRREHGYGEAYRTHDACETHLPKPTSISPVYN